MVFYDGRLPGMMSFAGGTGVWDEISFDTYFKARGGSVFATTLNDQSGNPSSSVVLWSNFFGGQQPNSLSSQRVTLVHEFAHSFLRIADHGDLIRALGITRSHNQPDATAALDQALGDCWQK